MATQKWFLLLGATAALVTGCVVDHMSVGAGEPEGAGGAEGGASGDDSPSSGGSIVDSPSSGGSRVDSPSSGGSLVTGGRTGTAGRSSVAAGTSGSGGSAGDPESSEGGESSTTGGNAGQGATGNAGSAGSAQAGSCGTEGLVCDAGYGDCDGDCANGCEVEFNTAAACGGMCGLFEACDVDGSAAACVNTTCASPWAAWVMPNAASTDPDAPNQADYVDNGDGSVLDTITGLIWQKTNSQAQLSWTESFEYCEQLTLGGRSGWRLPSRIELVSVEDPSNQQSGPLTYSTLPETLPMFWSSDRLDSQWVWYVWGPKAGGTDQDELHYARCVRR